MENVSSDKIYKELFYEGKTVELGKEITIDFIKENIQDILSKENINKYLDQNDINNLSKFLPLGVNINTIDLLENIKFIPPLSQFKSMLGNGYFSQDYQNNLEKLKIEGLEEYIKLFEKNYIRLAKIQKKKFDINNINSNSNIKENDESFSVKNEINEEDDINRVEFDNNSYVASSGYSTLNSEEEKEDILDNDNNDISGNNKHQENESVNEEGMLSNERFKNLKINKNQLTIRQRSKEEMKDFQRQEVERYKNAHLPWSYINSDDSRSVVAPVVKKLPSNTSSKPRDHVMLKPDRPSYVTILCLARDAASRLPDGVGSRADICDLLKDSQYINERLSDSQINNIVSGALDRLHYEKDPCVKYDLQKKLWIYLHKNRPLDFPAWNEHLKKIDIKNENKLEVDLELNSDEKIESQENIPATNNIPTRAPAHKKRKGVTGDKMLKNKRKHSK